MHRPGARDLGGENDIGISLRREVWQPESSWGGLGLILGGMRVGSPVLAGEDLK